MNNLTLFPIYSNNSFPVQINLILLLQTICNKNNTES